MFNVSENIRRSVTDGLFRSASSAYIRLDGGVRSEEET